MVKQYVSRLTDKPKYAADGVKRVSWSQFYGFDVYYCLSSDDDESDEEEANGPPPPPERNPLGKKALARARSYARDRPEDTARIRKGLAKSCSPVRPAGFGATSSTTTSNNQSKNEQPKFRPTSLRAAVESPLFTDQQRVNGGYGTMSTSPSTSSSANMMDAVAASSSVVNAKSKLNPIQSALTKVRSCP